MAATALEPRTEMCPSSGHSLSSAAGQRRVSHSLCELGTTRSWPPCTKRIGATTCAGSAPPRGDVGQVVVYEPPGPAVEAGPTTLFSQVHAPQSAA